VSDDLLPFKIARSNSHDELLAQAVNLLIAGAAYREAARIYPDELIELSGRAGDEAQQVAFAAQKAKARPIGRASPRSAALSAEDADRVDHRGGREQPKADQS
jgi:hypothetical protein